MRWKVMLMLFVSALLLSLWLTNLNLNLNLNPWGISQRWQWGGTGTGTEGTGTGPGGTGGGQAGENTFNRAKLLNIGFVEASKEKDYDCFIFSDVDIVPENDRNLYRCSQNPRHLACAMDKFGYKLPYTGYFGGVVAFTKEQYLKINGFSNNYWGWGTEDDDTYKRVTLSGMSVDRPDRNVGRTKMIRHQRDKGNEVNEKNYVIYNRMKYTRNQDGYISLKYSLIKIEKNQLFTKITVDIGKPPW
ncbi:beta-1,4-galactosyltransferase 2-like [Rhincodon typus]|uniref:beta-1,4-galactosyltransferase 2-like n=1 Tax=Rhincodon typus TaxID=259920 RepID=UPI00202FBD48|nr:beta-1,4-galactosyltransferase 2-like [Rhincodon typus]